MIQVNERYLAPPPGGSALSELLYGRLRTKKITCAEIEARLKCSPVTLRKILRNPEEADLETLRRIARILGISKTEFCLAWKW